MAALVAAVLLVVGGCATAAPRADEAVSWVEPSVAPSPSVTAARPSPSASAKPSTSAPASPKPSAKPSTRPRPKPEPTPTRKPVDTPVPPKPQPDPVQGCTKPFYVGTNATHSEVKAALDQAAATPVWTVSHVTLPPSLIEAVAWQESGWQSAIRACDGGVGTMQVMPNTQTFMNKRFGASWDMATLGGNTMIGSAYLQWLIKYFGDAYFDGDYTIDEADCASTDPAVPDYETPCLLNAVIASYNFGAGAVDQGTIVIPNPQYVSNVRALMDSCPCANF
jgi:transglycosylase-like protein with SLT domain